jgi:hypothetical protein
MNSQGQQVFFSNVRKNKQEIGDRKEETYEEKVIIFSGMQSLKICDLLKMIRLNKKINIQKNEI